ncbi:MAG: HAD hydrolase family protein [Victivallaceae bacterium]|nr:HAD hydrolase family protein [Victivallaceae bacterium]
MISNENFRRIKLVICDIDGVLTDGRVGYGADDFIKFFHYRDGHWLKLAMRAGLEVGWLSGRKSRANEERAWELGITFLKENVTDKQAAFDEILAERRLDATECFYIGDDVIDLPVMRRCGVAVAVADAVPELDEVADFRTRAEGGHGAVCEAVRRLLLEQGKLDSVLERYRR